MIRMKGAFSLLIDFNPFNSIREVLKEQENPNIMAVFKRANIT